METEYLMVTCRTARPSDKADMLALTKNIWHGEDYVPYVWDEWLADPHGRLVVAEYAGKVIGLGKLTRLSAEDWWLEGLRVDPAYEGRRVASQLYAEMVATWERIGGGCVRLMTSSTRLAVHRMSNRLGFTRIGEYAFFTAPPITSNTVSAAGMPPCSEAPGLPFQPLREDQACEATTYILANPIQHLVGELLDLGWQLAPARLDYLQQAARRCQAWWWRGRQGLLVFHEDREDQSEKPRPSIELLACPADMISRLLLDFRRLAGELGCAEVTWIAALHPELLPHLEAAGFLCSESHSLYVFSKQKV